MKKYLIFLILFQLIAQSLLAQDKGFDQEALDIMRRYKVERLENGLSVLSLKTTDSLNVFLRLYTDIPQNVPKQYRAFIEIEQQLQKSSIVNLPKGWKTTDLNSLNIKLQKDSMGYFLSCPMEQLDTAVFLLSKILPEPSTTAKQLAETKNAYKQILNSPKNPVSEKIELITKGIIYGKDHPASILLSNKELDALLISKYEEYYTHFYLPNNSYLLIMGKLNSERAVMLAQKHFADLKNKKLPVSNYKLNKIEEGRVLFFDTLATGHYKLSMIFPFSLHPFTFDYEKSELLSLYIQNVLKEKLIKSTGLVSEINAGFHSDGVSGNYRLDFTLKSDSAAKVVDITLRTIDAVKKREVDVVILDIGQRAIIKKFKAKATGIRNVSQLIVKSEVNNLEDDYYTKFIRTIKNADNQMIASLAAKYLNFNSSVISLNGKWYPSLNDVLNLSKNFRIELYNLDGSIKRVIPKGFSGFNVLNNYINTLGGRSAISKIKDLNIKLTGKYKISGEELFIIGEIKHKSPDKYYQVLSLLRPKKDTIFLNQQVYNGERALNRGMQGKKLLHGSKLELMKYKSIIVPETKYQEWGFKTRILRADTLNNSYVFVVEFTNPAKQKFIDFYDVDKGIRYKRFIEDSAYLNKRTIIYKDYQKIEGENVLYPFYQHIKAKNIDIQLIIRKIDTKGKIDRSIFEILDD
jgi:predicted Zn-dependent peptidase